MKKQNPVCKAIGLLLLCLFLMGPGFNGAYASDLPDAAQQQRTITGKVTDYTGAPLPGVTVVVKNTTIGIVTNLNGEYSLQVPENAQVLVYSFVGMQPQEITISGRTNINVTMIAQITGLDEVVVVGYGQQRRAHVVGAVTSVDGSTLQAIPAVNVSNALSGRLPGSVVIQQTGEPGQHSPRILVRGRSTLGGARASNVSNTAPLIIIDGIPGRSMDDIDPNDVASVSVLKDASAAIYGAQAANGVILITTRSGQEGKPRLNYQFFEGFMTPSIIPQVTNAAEYATMLTEYQVATGRTRTFSDASIELFRNGRDPWGHPNSDWYSDLIKDWTTTNRHSLTLDGGSRGMNYYVSLGLKSDDAMYKASSTKYKQYNVRTKLDFQVNDWLKTGMELAGFLNNRIYPLKSADAIVGQSTRLFPTQWSYWPNGKPGPDVEYGDNPVVTSTLEPGKDDHKTYRLLSTFNATITVPFVEGLSLGGSFSYDLTNFYRKRFFKPWILYFPDWANATRDPVTGFVTDMPLRPTVRGLSSPQHHEDYQRTINQTSIINANFIRSFGDHNVSAFVGFEQFTSDYNGLYAFRQYYISSLIQTMDAGSPRDQNITGTMTIHARKSWIGRVSYNYQEKYLAEFLFRRDGSLKFPPKGRWGNFPGFLVGWRASEEGFWKNNLAFVNSFKLRASYGMMGMDPGDPFQYMDRYGLSSGMVFGTGGAIETAVGPPVVANPAITWEKQTTYNVGFDSRFANNLFHLNTEFFYNVRTDILAARDASVPRFTGLTLPNENIARVDNRGFEVDAGIHKSINNDLRFDLSANFSFNRNEVVFQDEPARAVPWQQTTGKSYGAWLMYDAIGIFRDQAHVDSYPRMTGARPGDIIFRDVSGDGTITGDDRILVEFVDFPETFYGVTLDAFYKNFTLSVHIQGQGKFYKFNHYDNRRGVAGNYFKWTYDNRWTPENTNTNIARAFNRDDFYWSPDVNLSTYWLDNTAYCRLKNLVLNYSIPAKFYSSLGISRANVYLSGNNVALLYSATRKFDPESNGAGVYPIMRTYAIGASITF